MDIVFTYEFHFRERVIRLFCENVIYKCYFFISQDCLVRGNAYSALMTLRNEWRVYSLRITTGSSRKISRRLDTGS